MISPPKASSGSYISQLNFKLKRILKKMIPADRQLIRTGEYFLTHGEREVHLLPQWIKPGTTAIDVGSHIGDYTYAICKYLGASGKVIAIEPQPRLANELSKATKKLGMPVTVYNCALSSKDGEAELVVPLDKGIVSPGLATLEPRTGEIVDSYRVPLRRLDDVCRDVTGPISFMKIDVEGHELEVLKGSREILTKHYPNLLIEIENRHTQKPIAETFEFLFSLGYHCQFLNPAGELVPFSQFTIEKNQSMNKLGTTEYVSNFIFKKA